MNIQIREYKDSDIQEMNRIWNRVVDDGVAFPQEDDLTEETGRGFFAGQTYTAVAEDTDTGKVLGLYILHPNNVGRCGHICNASYAVDADVRGFHIERSWCLTVWYRQRRMIIWCCSLMRWWLQMCMQDTSMRGLDLRSLERFRVVFA